MAISFRIYLNNLVSMLLFIKAVVPLVISSMVPFAVQTLESVRTEYTSYISLSKRVKFGISLVLPR